MNISIQLEYWKFSSWIGERIVVVLRGWTQSTPQNKIEKNAKQKKKVNWIFKSLYFVCS